MFRRACTLAAMLLCARQAQAQSSEPGQAADEQAQTPKVQASFDPYQAYAEGRFADAFDGFANLQVKRPKDVDLMLNLGASLYRLEDYAGAEKAWSLAAEHGDPNIRAQALYDMGNSAFKQKHLEQAVQHFESALSLNPNDDDTHHNLQLAKKQLEMQEQSPKAQDPNAPKDPQDPNQSASQGAKDPNRDESQQPDDAKDAKNPNDAGDPSPDQGKDGQKPDGHDKKEPTAGDDPAKKDGKDMGDDKTDDPADADAPKDGAEPHAGEPDGPQDPKRMPRSQAERLLDAMGESRPRHAPPADKAGQRPPDGMDW